MQSAATAAHSFFLSELCRAVRWCMLGVYNMLQQTIWEIHLLSRWHNIVKAYLFGVPDLCSVCVHDQQLLVAFPRCEANLLHPATMCWYSPENINSVGCLVEFLRPIPWSFIPRITSWIFWAGWFLLSHIYQVAILHFSLHSTETWRLSRKNFKVKLINKNPIICFREL